MLKPLGLACMVVLIAGCKDGPAPAPAPATPIARAGAWMATFPVEDLRYDAAIVTAAIARLTDDESVRRAAARARAVADRDHDNPLRRAFDDGYRAERGSVAGWEVPAPGGERINPNRVIAEALHCPEHGLRTATITYATGAMRDQGGFHTTHAVWALALARDRGCLDDARFSALARPLLDELRATQPPEPPSEVVALDLYAERLLMLRLAGEAGPDLDAMAARLAAAQGADGGFGVLAPDEDPYRRYHATMVSTWALALGRLSGPRAIDPASASGGTAGAGSR